MTNPEPSPAWNGPTVVGICRGCDGNFEIPDRGPDAESHRGHCPTCNRQRTFDYWRGPVTVV